MKIFSLQYNFLRPSPYGLRTEENDANFLPYQLKKAHHITYQKISEIQRTWKVSFLQFKIYLTFHLKLIDHTKIKGKRRKIWPIETKFSFPSKWLPKKTNLWYHKNISFWMMIRYYKKIYPNVYLYIRSSSSNSIHRLPTSWRLRKILLLHYSKKGIFQ